MNFEVTGASCDDSGFWSKAIPLAASDSEASNMQHAQIPVQPKGLDDAKGARLKSDLIKGMGSHGGEFPT